MKYFNILSIVIQKTWLKISALILMLSLGAVCNAQDLREMDVQQVESKSIVVFANYPTSAAVQIESTISGLRIDSNIGIVTNSSDPSTGIYRVILKPGRQILSFSAPRFITSTYNTENIEARTVLHLRIVPKNVVITDKGSFEITTQPTGANLQIDGLPGVFKTTYRADGIFALRYTARVSMEGYYDESFFLDITANQLTLHHLILRPIVAIERSTIKPINSDTLVLKSNVEIVPTTVVPEVKSELLIDKPAMWQCGDHVNDIEGNSYATSKIGDLCWMTENLRTSLYATGSLIAQVPDDVLWNEMRAGAWSHYQNSNSYDESFGKLYNWHAVNNPNQLCPADWFVPTDNDWSDLINTFNGNQAKNKGTQRIKLNAAAEAGFYIQSGGYRLSNGAFHFMGSIGHWWTSSDYFSSTGWSREIMTRKGTIRRHNYLKNNGLSVRCVSRAG